MPVVLQASCMVKAVQKSYVSLSMGGAKYPTSNSCFVEKGVGRKEGRKDKERRRERWWAITLLGGSSVFILVVLLCDSLLSKLLNDTHMHLLIGSACSAISRSDRKNTSCIVRSNETTGATAS